MIKDNMKEIIIKERILGKKTVNELVDEYGVSAGSISRWTRDYLASHTESEVAELGIDKRSELARLRRENKQQFEEIKRLTNEKNILEEMLMKLYERSAAFRPMQPTQQGQSVQNDSLAPTQVNYINQYTGEQNGREVPPDAEPQPQ